MALFDLSEKARVLHAALSFPTFTADDLSAFSGVKRETVHTTLTREKDLIERVGKDDIDGPGGRPIRYRLRQNVREQLATEVVELAAKLRPDLGTDRAEARESTEAALRAVESSLALAGNPEGSGESADYWRRRAGKQLELATQLLELVPAKHRQPLQGRFEALRLQMEPAEAAKATNVHAEWKRFVQQMRRGIRDAVTLPVKDVLTTEPFAVGRRHLAPAALFDAIDDKELRTCVVGQLRAAHRPFVEVDLAKVVAALGNSPQKVAFLEALEISPHDTAFIVTLDSSDEASRKRVEAFLGYLKDHLWLKNAAKAPEQAPEITLLDRSSNNRFVRANQLVRNLRYYNQMKKFGKPAMASMMAAVVRNTDDDAKSVF